MYAFYAWTFKTVLHYLTQVKTKYIYFFVFSCVCNARWVSFANDNLWNTI